MYGHRINLLLLFFSLHVSAQVSPVARYHAMGNTGTALQGLESLTSNNAGIAGLSTATAGAYFQTHTQYRAIRNIGLLVAIPSSLGTLGLQVSRYGMQDIYRETKAGLSYAKSFGHHLFASIRANYQELHLAHDGKGTAYSFDVGLQYQIRQKWWLGAYVTNPLSAAYNYATYAVIPIEMRLGASYHLHTGLTLTADIEKVLYKQKTDLRTGIEYKPNAWLCLRGGMSASDFTQFCGVGLSYRKVILDMAATVHTHLGLSPQILLAYAF